MRAIACFGVTLALFLQGNSVGAQEDLPHWTYAEVDTWHELKNKRGELPYRECKGLTQSPVDFKIAFIDYPNTSEPGAKHMLEYAKPEIPLLASNNGHTIKIETAANQQENFVTFSSPNKMCGPGAAAGCGSGDESTKKFFLKEIHFHAPSEHLIEGRQYDLEAHFVHKSADNQISVVAVMFVPGTENLALGALLGNLAQLTTTQQTFPDRFNIGDLQPTIADASGYRQRIPGDFARSSRMNKAGLRYWGSLTTPPCTPQVNWYVLVQPVQASAKQIADLGRALNNNRRPFQYFVQRRYRHTDTPDQYNFIPACGTTEGCRRR